MNQPAMQPGEGGPRLAERVSRSLNQVENYANRLAKSSGAYSLGGIVASAGATALTGWTSVAGPIFGDSVLAWRITCIIAAILGFFTTIFMSISQTQRYSERLAHANECIGRLKAVQFALEFGAGDTQETWQEFSLILRQYPEELR